ncbi:MAG: DUF1178 family protein [Rhodospirillaceae bacterium]
MIVYQLRCSNGHEFEAWFRDSATYETQAKDGDVACPQCGDVFVSKAIMAPNIAPARKRRPMTPEENDRAERRAREVAERILEAVSNIRSHVEDNFENVGDKFAEEAKRIHYGEAEERGIYGEATTDEAEELDDEGIEFYRLPNTGRRDS